MDEIETALMAFDSGTTDKCSVVELLADSLDERVVALFLKAMLDESGEDLVRVEILKSLPFRNDSPTNRNRFGEAAMQILRSDEDELVRQYAAKSMRRFVSCDGAVELLERIIRNESDDIDVRHNALSAIEANASSPHCRETLGRLVQIPVLGKSAERTLQRISQSS
jgi:HEAT repeat protein